MVAVSERYQGSRGIKEQAPGDLVKRMLMSQPSVRLAGQLYPEEDKTVFFASPLKPASLYRYDILNRDVDSMAGEIPNSKITHFNIDLSTAFLKDADPNMAVKIGRIESTLFSETNNPHNIEVLYYPHPWIADVIYIFQKMLLQDKNKRFHPDSRLFQSLTTTVRNEDMTDEYIARFRRMLYEIKQGEKPRRAWRAPGI